MSKSKGSVKTGIIALITIVVLLVAGLTAVLAFGINDEEADSDLIALIACTEEDIQRIELDNARDTFAIVQNGYSEEDILQWKIEGQDNTDVDVYNLKTIVQRCYKLNARRELGTINTNNSEAMALYGFNEPSATAKVIYNDNGSTVTRTFVVGAAFGQDFFMYEKDTGRYYVVPSTVGYYFMATSNEIRILPSLSVNMGNVGVISLSRKNSVTLNFAYMPSQLGDTRAWQMIAPIGSYVNSTNWNNYETAISEFAMELYVAPAVGDDAKIYGFDSPYATLTLMPPIVSEEYAELTKGLLSQIIIVGDPLEEIDGYRYCCTYVLQNDDTSEGKVAQSKVYAISDETVAKIFDINAIDIMDRQVILTNITSIKQVEIYANGKRDIITVERKPVLDDDGNYVYTAENEQEFSDFFTYNKDTEDEIKLKETCFRAFYTRLISLSVVAFVRDDDTHDFGDIAFETRLVTNIVPAGYEESGATTVMSATFYEMDSNYYLIKFNGQGNVAGVNDTEERYNICKAKKSDVESVIAAYAMCLDGTLPGIRE